ncbi:DUF2513 domain-containing protein [Clostridium paraputrificum]|uniref:DUF2513 domain-containing protein n=1 Tax=Clostridium paraputrificum TaxID=29363 RepID=UPI0006C6BBF7|nr:DUF2513 domain-containing protein [Clostridium paraputrificum]CUO14520.1 Uncharacterised protein [Clostridium paraputrificum]
MRLDNDCIRDILLFIEDNTDYEKEFVSSEEILDGLHYDKNTLFYHIDMVSQAKLVDNVFYAEDEPQEISRLSWEGHQYLDNIREDHIWKAVKEKANTVGSVSLQVMIPLATAIIQQKLGLS